MNKTWSYFLCIWMCLANSAAFARPAPTWKYMEDVCTVKTGSCDYYQCAERVHKCERDGYYKKFAQPYCNTFLTQTIREVSPRGKKWLRDVAACLQKKLAYYTKDTDPCWFVEEMAIKTHAECYVEASGCELDVSDLTPVVATFAKEFGDSRIFWQGIDFVVDCAKRY